MFPEWLSQLGPSLPLWLRRWFRYGVAATMAVAVAVKSALACPYCVSFDLEAEIALTLVVIGTTPEHPVIFCALIPEWECR